MNNDKKTATNLLITSYNPPVLILTESGDATKVYQLIRALTPAEQQQKGAGISSELANQSAQAEAMSKLTNSKWARTATSYNGRPFELNDKSLYKGEIELLANGKAILRSSYHKKYIEGNEWEMVRERTWEITGANSIKVYDKEFRFSDDGSFLIEGTKTDVSQHKYERIK